MKTKIIPLILCVVMLLSMTACGTNNKGDKLVVAMELAYPLWGNQEVSLL